VVVEQVVITIGEVVAVVLVPIERAQHHFLDQEL
jgi:hypothetical protein